MNYSAEIENSVQYLSSAAAFRSLAADSYWPKWNSPWWHMLLLHEMGETSRIPSDTVEAYISSLNKIPLKIFPIQPEEMPPDVDPYRGSACHCQLGNVYQVLAAWGVDVDRELPWIRPWFLRYQMADGGMNCDNGAYLIQNEVPSSMVGMISAFEAILKYTPRGWTAEESAFLDKGARFLIGRKLIHGSATTYNASERASAESWVKLCFPRFYLYDVLRGMTALLTWSEKTGRPIPVDSVREAFGILEEKFPDGNVRPERLSFEGATTLLQSRAGEWQRGQPATLFPLLNKTSALDQISPFLSRQWAEAKAKISGN